MLPAVADAREPPVNGLGASRPTHTNENCSDVEKIDLIRSKSSKARLLDKALNQREGFFSLSPSHVARTDRGIKEIGNLVC
jgi:hypothetical protein